MRKLVLSVVLTTAMSLSLFANNPVEGKPSKNNRKIENKLEKVLVEKNKVNLKNQSDVLTTVSCSVTITGANGASITYTATAGNWFSGLAGATERCAKKLAHLGEASSYTIH